MLKRIVMLEFVGNITRFPCWRGFLRFQCIEIEKEHLVLIAGRPNRLGGLVCGMVRYSPPSFSAEQTI